MLTTTADAYVTGPPDFSTSAKAGAAFEAAPGGGYRLTSQAAQLLAEGGKMTQAVANDPTLANRIGRTLTASRFLPSVVRLSPVVAGGYLTAQYLCKSSDSPLCWVFDKKPAPTTTNLLVNYDRYVHVEGKKGALFTSPAKNAGPTDFRVSGGCPAGAIDWSAGAAVSLPAGWNTKTSQAGIGCSLVGNWMAGLPSGDYWVGSRNGYSTDLVVFALNANETLNPPSGYKQIKGSQANDGRQAVFTYLDASDSLGTPKLVQNPGSSPADGGKRTVDSDVGDTSDEVRSRIVQSLLEDDATGAAIQQYLNSLVDKSVQDPTVNTVTVPSINANETASAYVGRLQALGLGFVRTVVSTAAADVTKPAGAVLDIDPKGGAVVAAGSTVKVQENPDPMPVVVLAPAANETYDAYIARLRAKGYTGTARKVVNSDATLDPKRGPNAVTGVAPDAGSRIAPSDEVVVRVNPENAPGTSAGGGGPTGTGLDPINFDPLNKATPCNSFPFGVPCWVVNALGGFNATGKAPSMSMALPFGQRVTADFTWWAPIAAIYKPVMLFASYLLLAWAFMRLTLSGNDGD